MRNCPEYVAIWIGLCKIGVRTALINSNLKSVQLAHSFGEAKCKAVIVESKLIDNVCDIQGDLPPGAQLFVYRNGEKDEENEEKTLSNALILDDLLLAASSDRLDDRDRSHSAKMTDPLLYVYTSGTTGLPKAAKISHTRMYLMVIGFSTMCNVSENDRFYNALPLYHSAGGLLGIGMTIYNGAFTVLRRKFSASQLSHDLQKHECTTLQYIGEMCRFALSSAATGDYVVEKAIGNGLRKEVWQPFQEKYNIQHIYEFYGATEGAGALINTENRVGAVGFLTPLVDPFLKIRIARVDASGHVVRRADGFVDMVDVGESGEMLIEIQNNSIGSNFDGYQSSEATVKKTIGNVLTLGDNYFRTSDLLKQDKEGFVYFKDRVGDTYRWKGENVSSEEVVGVVRGVWDGEVCCYGVQVEGCEGRAGCLALVSPPSTDLLTTLHAHLAQHLTPYTVPLFYRFINKIDNTSTFKVKKALLREDGIVPGRCGGGVWWWSGEWTLVDQIVYEKIINNEYKL
eukprot:TRINITY_DN3969_c0_g2_i1.p1 TRINITY_DN3969_c0_g2~~TRINITY_DN3969_c0_g2_i1.p1  ORF type:complete len:513 (+),score=42.26 TRINITY_DN3969_c0_g2_i1:174-1712(+)